MTVKEIYKTIQGEGANTGRIAVFCRFAGCNLWSGREKDRSTAVCQFCDTNFVGGEKYNERSLVSEIIETWGKGTENRFVVFTGGEPALQLTSTLIYQLQRDGFDVAVETNGSIPLPTGVYWTTVSPKKGAELKQNKGSELKVVWPQEINLEDFSKLNFRHFYLQPMDGVSNSTEECIKEIQKNPKWKLSLQTHKLIGIP